MKIIRALWKVLISLKFAVVVMVILTTAMVAATFIESLYDFQTALFYVYRTWWFYATLGALGTLIFCVAMSRLPWQKKHIPFLMAHLGILLLLYGSWLTDRFGVDGMLSVDEGLSESAVEINEPLLVLADGQNVETVKIPWLPPEEKFKPISIPRHGITVDQWITHAESNIAFLPSNAGIDAKPALKVKVSGGPGAPPFMRMGQEFWLWSGDPTWSDVQAGGARLMMTSASAEPVFKPSQPTIAFRIDRTNAQGSYVLRYQVQTSEGKKSKGEFKFSDSKELVGRVIETGWKFEAKVTIQEVIPQAMSDVKYVPSRIQYGSQTNPPAIRLRATSTDPAREGATIWLGQGERAVFESQGKNISIGFFPRRVMLPFGILLHRFEIERYEGTMNPKEFSSVVSISGGKPEGQNQPPQNVKISMNEPLKWGGYTFYQSSYVDAQPRPITSVFSVNQDPGRWLKYLGSLLIVLGTILLFAVKYIGKPKTHSGVITQ
jgi:hypothetical protein